MASMYSVYSRRSNDEGTTCEESTVHDAGTEAEVSRTRSREEHTAPMPSTPPQPMSAYPRTQFRDVTRLTTQCNNTNSSSSGGGGGGGVVMNTSNTASGAGSSKNYTSRRVPLRQGMVRSLRYDTAREADHQSSAGGATITNTVHAPGSTGGNVTAAAQPPQLQPQPQQHSSLCGVSSPLQRRLGSESTARNVARNVPPPRHVERRTSNNASEALSSKPRVRSARAHKPLLSASEEHTMMSMTPDTAPPLTLPALQPVNAEASRRAMASMTTLGSAPSHTNESHGHVEWSMRAQQEEDVNGSGHAMHDTVSHVSKAEAGGHGMTLSQLPSLLARGKPSSQVRHVMPLRRSPSEAALLLATQDHGKSETKEPVPPPPPPSGNNVSVRAPPRLRLPRPPTATTTTITTTTAMSTTATTSFASTARAHLRGSHEELHEQVSDDNEEEQSTKKAAAAATTARNEVHTRVQSYEPKPAETSSNTGVLRERKNSNGGGATRWSGAEPETKRRRSSETCAAVTDAQGQTSKDDISHKAQADAPWTWAEALQRFGDCLTGAERSEIQQYSEVYYCGERAARSGLKSVAATHMYNQPNTNTTTGGSRACEESYTDAEGNYRVTPGDHIAYRYEVIDILGHGNFATVVRAIDHGKATSKNKSSKCTTSNSSSAAAVRDGASVSFCALKVFRAGRTFAEAAEKEAAMLTRLSQAIAAEEEEQEGEEDKEEEDCATPLAAGARSERNKENNISSSSSRHGSLTQPQAMKEGSSSNTTTATSHNPTRAHYFTASPLLAQLRFRDHRILVLPLYGMDLAEFMRVNEARPLPPALTQSVLAQLIYWLHILHNKAQVVHADVKPDNVVLVDRSGQDMAMPSFLASACNNNNSDDDGEAYPVVHMMHELRAAREAEPIVTTRVALVDYGNAQPHDATCVFPAQSLFYRAPEVVLRLPYTSAMDMWSVGCIMYELLTGHTMWLVQSEEELLHKALAVLGFPDGHFREMLKKSWRAYRAARGQQQQQHQSANNNTSEEANEQQQTMEAEMQALETCWRSFMQQLSTMAAAARQANSLANTEEEEGNGRSVRAGGSPHAALASLLRALNFTSASSAATTPPQAAAYSTACTQRACNEDDEAARAAHGVSAQVDEQRYSEEHVLLLDFLLGCLYWSAEERLTAREALAHPYLAPLFTSEAHAEKPTSIVHYVSTAHTNSSSSQMMLSETEVVRRAMNERGSGMYFLAHHTLTATCAPLLQAACFWHTRRRRCPSAHSPSMSISLARHSANNLTAVFTEATEEKKDLGEKGQTKAAAHCGRTRVPSASPPLRLNVLRTVFPLQESAARLVRTPCQAQLCTIATTDTSSALMPCNPTSTTNTMSTTSNSNEENEHTMGQVGGKGAGLRQDVSSNQHHNNGLAMTATATTSPALYPISAPLQISSSQNVLSLQYYLNATCVSRKSAYDLDGPLSFHGLYHTGPSFISGENTTPPWETEWGLKQ